MSLTLTEREEILEREISKYTAHGWTLKEATQTDATVIPPGRKGNAAADGCLTVVWLGYWIIPALIGAASGRYSKARIHINTDGTVLIIGPKAPR